MTTYEAVVTREDPMWLADVPAVPGAHTFARSLQQQAGHHQRFIGVGEPVEQRQRRAVVAMSGTQSTTTLASTTVVIRPPVLRDQGGGGTR
jgi:predicted RNase H-like HicB family nuclease